MTDRTALVQFVLANAIRGDCTCGSCIDAHEPALQPPGHTVDLTFFKVAAKPKAQREEFKALVEREYPDLLDGKEHNYIHIGAEIGDQGTALMLIGLGGLLNLWKVLSPNTMIPDLPEEMKKAMAQQGMVALMTPEGFTAFARSDRASA